MFQLLAMRRRAAVWALAGLAAALALSHVAHPGVLRRVQLAVSPAGSRVLLGDREVAWFGEIIGVPPGSHPIRIDVPQSKCCRALASSIEVTPPPTAEPTAVQAFTFRLEILPARAVLIGAPEGAYYRCAAIGLAGPAGAIQEVRLGAPRWTGICELLSPGGALAGSVRVTVDAGELNAILWPR